MCISAGGGAWSAVLPILWRHLNRGLTAVKQCALTVLPSPQMAPHDIVTTGGIVREHVGLLLLDEHQADHGPVSIRDDSIL